MDQIFNNVMSLAQSVTVQREKMPENDANREEGKSFRDLLAQKQSNEVSQSTKEPTQTEQKLPVAQEGVAKQESELDAQSFVAAIPMMQMPVLAAQWMTVEAQAPVTPETVVAQATNLMPGKNPVSAGLTELQPQQPQQMQPQQQIAGVETQQVKDGIQLKQDMQMLKEQNLQTKPIETGKNSEVQLLDDTVKVEEERVLETPVFHSTKDVFVKVGEVSGGESVETAETMETPVKDQLGKQISQAFERGDMRVAVRLNPENLGQVNVELSLTKDGALHIELRAENQMTQRLLERETMGLQHILMRNTQQDVQVEVVRSQEHQQQGFEDNRQNGHQQNPQQEHKEEPRGTNDFLHQLRLGLIPLDAEAS